MNVWIKQPTPVFMLLGCLTLAACSPQIVTTPSASTPPSLPSTSATLDQGRTALVTFFDLLHAGRYVEAEHMYNGPFDVISGWNPSVPRHDHARLIEAACVNQLRCLPIKQVTEATSLSPNRFRFMVEFQDADGAVFARGPCCGATEAEMPTQTQFPYEVSFVEGHYFVNDLGVYVP